MVETRFLELQQFNSGMKKRLIEPLLGFWQKIYFSSQLFIFRKIKKMFQFKEFSSCLFSCLKTSKWFVIQMLLFLGQGLKKQKLVQRT